MYAIIRAGNRIVVGEVRETIGPHSLISIKGAKGIYESKILNRYILRQFSTMEELKTVTGLGIEESSDHPVATLSVRETLELFRSQFETIGLVDRNTSVRGAFTAIASPFHVYMKKDPFRDICKIHEGTAVQIQSYYKGCAVIEADGEEFYLPVEAKGLIEQAKDDHYYFSLDYDRDNIPDPLVACPSKVALGGKPSRPTDNYNAQPDLPKVAGNLYPLPHIGMGDVSILQTEAYTAQCYSNDYQQYWPNLHGLGGPTVEDIARALVVGNGSPKALFLRNLDYSTLERTYVEEFEKVFPGVKPDLEGLRRTHAEALQ